MPTSLPPSGWRPSRPGPSWRLALGLVAAAACGSVWADRTDRNQPLNFAADTAKVDEIKQLNILTGNVEITKGTIVIRADRVEVRQSPDGYQAAVATGWPDRRATFRQKREATDEVIEGEAERLEYDSRTDTMKLVSQAVMRRFRGNVLADEVRGNTITYDNGTEVFQVLGGTNSAAPAGRVRGVLTPRSAASAAFRARGCAVRRTALEDCAAAVAWRAGRAPG